MSVKDQLDKNRIPQHVAIIMDGNGRWAKAHGQDRVFGHQHGVDSVDKVVEAAKTVGVKYLTLYAFSTENWNRPEAEVTALMELLSSALKMYTEKLKKHGVKLTVIGDWDRLSEVTKQNLTESIEATSQNNELTMIIAISYSARWEITEAAKQMAKDVKAGVLDADKITEDTISNYLSTKGIPDPDLLIRTSGELRISNFLMWQLSYSELYFTDVCWPDFKEEEFYKAILDYQSRERRFGKTSEQIS